MSVSKKKSATSNSETFTRSRTRHTLIQRLRDSSNEEAWEIFTDAYGNFINGVLGKLGVYDNDAPDLTQEVLLKLWTQLPDFHYEPQKGKFRSWLYQIIKNTAYSYFRSSSSKLNREKRYSYIHIENEDILHSMIDIEWKNFICDRALAQIRDSHSEQSLKIFERSLNGETVQSLASEYGLKTNTVHRVKNRIKERLILEIQHLKRELE